MDEKTRKIREAIDCCRPGSDDLRAPELAFLADAIGPDAVDPDAELREAYQRSQEFDAHIQRVYHDVPVPEGLEERLLASLAWDGDRQPECRPPEHDRDAAGMTGIVEAATSPAHATSESDPTSATAVLPPREPRRAGESWRYAMYLGVPALVLMALIVGILVGINPTPSQISLDDLLRHSDAAVSTSLKEGHWDGDLATVPSDRKFPSQTVEGELRGWQKVQIPGIDDRVVAHLLSERAGSEVVLLVFDCPREIVGLNAEPSKLPASGQQSVGAWQANGQVYVLVVRGRGHAQRYQSLLRTRGQMAELHRKVSPVCLIGRV